MTYRPKTLDNKPKVISLCLAAAAVVMFVFSAYAPSFVAAYQLTALILAVVSLEMYVKYVGSDYVYEAAESSLKVYRVNGKKSTCLCSLDYSQSLSEIVSSKEYLTNKQKFPKTNFNLNYAKNLNPASFYVYFFEFNGKKSMIKFEPDEIFVKYANDKINSSKNIQ